MNRNHLTSWLADRLAEVSVGVVLLILVIAWTLEAAL